MAGARPHEAHPERQPQLKPKVQRQHHARKRLSREDPRRICPPFRKYGGCHSMGATSPVWAELSDGTALLKTQCHGCQQTIEAVADLDEDGRLTWENLQRVAWRTWRYIIEEEPV